MIPSKPSRRVAARYAASHAPANDSEPLITDVELLDTLVAWFGPITWAHLHAPVTDEGTATWEATTEAGDHLEGTVTPKVEIIDDEVHVSPKIVVVSPPSRTATETPKQLLDERLQDVAQRLRRLVTRMRTQPDLPAHEFAAELTEIADTAEGTNRR